MAVLRPIFEVQVEDIVEKQRHRLVSINAKALHDALQKGVRVSEFEHVVEKPRDRTRFFTGGRSRLTTSSKTKRYHTWSTK